MHPAVSPVLVAPQTRRLSTGQSLGVTFHAPGQAGERVGVLLAGNGPASTLSSRDTGGRTDGTLFFGGAPHGQLAPAAYDVVLLSPSPRCCRARPFWLYPPGTHASISTDSSTYTVGQPIGVSWDHAPGMALDWVGVFRCYPAGCAGNGGYLLYWYTHTAIRGSGVIGPGADTFPGAIAWPLPPGTYVRAAAARRRLPVDRRLAAVHRHAVAGDRSYTSRSVALTDSQTGGAGPQVRARRRPPA